MILTLKFLGLDLVRDLSVYDLNRDYSVGYGSFSYGIIMVDSDELIFCSLLFLVGCRTTLVCPPLNLLINILEKTSSIMLKNFGIRTCLM